MERWGEICCNLSKVGVLVSLPCDSNLFCFMYDLRDEEGDGSDVIS